ncbi:malectin domain-containing carbohydrate-binding protein [Cyclobacterium qasimii]|uniref:malectin domain-containing carbohydrate-binding protein n=1 Tax=Cyclobacterium qasimii TaxID=1350429 RepID=UPI0034DAE439
MGWGWFNSYDSEPAAYMIRLNADGSKDTSFIAADSINREVKSIALQADGKILVNTGNKVFRLETDGSYDPSFILPSPFGEKFIDEDYGPQENGFTVNSIKVLGNGKIIFAGSFSTSLKHAVNLIRLNPDGSMDSSFTTYDYEKGYEGQITKIVLTPEGKIFSIFGSEFYNQSVRLFNADGTIDFSFDTYRILPGNAIALQADGKLIAGEYRGEIIRYNLDGSVDLSYNPKPEFDDEVKAFGVQKDGKVVVGGAFNRYNGQLGYNIVRINTNGTFDHSFNAGSGLDNQDDFITEIHEQQDGDILVNGNIKSFNGTQVNQLFRLRSDGKLDQDFNSNLEFESNFYIVDVALQEDGKILVAGQFRSFGKNVNEIIRLNQDGTRDNSFDLGIDSDTRILTIYALKDGKILVGAGSDGNPAGSLVRLNADGSKDLSFNIGSDLNINWTSIAVQSDGKILAGGGASASVLDPRLVRFNPDGTIDSSFNAEIESQSVHSIMALTDGGILIKTDDSDNEKTLLRLNADGSIDPRFHTVISAGDLQAIAVLPDGNILVGGEFVYYNGTKTNYIARLINSIATFDELKEVVRINAGGEAIDLDGEQWQADQYYTGGRVYFKINPIENTENDALYQTERNGDFSYEIPVTDQGLYTVVLHFAEIHWQKPGARLFQVAIEGGEPGSVIDLFKDHGGANTANELKMEDIKVLDGHLSIEFITTKDNAKISGIAVYKHDVSTEPEKLRINSGGEALDFGNEQWL